MVKLLVLLTVFICATPAGTAQPAEDPYTHDFGTLSAGAVIEHAFILENKGELPLQIRDVTTSCGCTATRVNKTMLLPGDAATIEVKFDSAGYTGDTVQYVYVATDDTDVPVVKYTITAHVIPAPAGQAPAAK